MQVNALSFKNKDCGRPFLAGGGNKVTVPFNLYEDWQITGGCSIVSPLWLKAWMDVRAGDTFQAGTKWVWAMTSGGYDPVHPGHISCMWDGFSKVEGKHQRPPCSLIVVVNGDNFLTQKKGKPFMPLKVRCQVVSSIRRVDYVVPLTVPKGDMTVCEAIRILRPSYFLKGGDRTDIENIPEWDLCQTLGVEIITGCGDDKLWSSSNFLKEWSEDG